MHSPRSQIQERLGRIKRFRYWFVSPPWPDERPNRTEIWVGIVIAILAVALLVGIVRDWIPWKREYWSPIVGLSPVLPLLIALYALWRQWRPVVIVTPIVENSCLYLQVKNFGGGLARGVKVRFWDRNYMYNAAGDLISSIGPAQGIPALPPGERYLELLGRADEYFNIDYLMGDHERTESATAIVHFRGVILPWHIFSERQPIEMTLVNRLPYGSAGRDLDHHKSRFGRDRPVPPWGFSDAETRWANDSLKYIQESMAQAEGWPPQWDLAEPSRVMDALNSLGYTVMPPSKKRPRDEICVAVSNRGELPVDVLAARRIADVPPWTILLRYAIEMRMQSHTFPYRMTSTVEEVQMEDDGLSYVPVSVEMKPPPLQPDDV